MSVVIIAKVGMKLHNCNHGTRTCCSRIIRAACSIRPSSRAISASEIDLLLAWPDGRLWAIEVKRSLTPKLERGFHAACADLQPERRFVVYPGSERYRLAAGIEAIPLPLLAEIFAADDCATPSRQRRLLLARLADEVDPQQSCVAPSTVGTMRL